MDIYQKRLAYKGSKNWDNFITPILLKCYSTSTYPLHLTWTISIKCKLYENLGRFEQSAIGFQNNYVQKLYGDPKNEATKETYPLNDFLDYQFLHEY